MPTIMRKNFIANSQNIIKHSIENFNIKGIVISNLSQLELIPTFPNLSLVGNYTLNIYNINTIKELENLKIKTVTISPELDENGILSICDNSSSLK